jgi:ABC-type multidrug transport system fused ATPase/permease subunit
LNNNKDDYLKQRYKNSSGIYIFMLLLAAIFFTIGIAIVLIVITNNVPAGLIFGVPCLGFGFGFGFHAIKTLSIKIKSVRLIDKGKSGTGQLIRLRAASYGPGPNSGRKYIKFCIVFKYTNDNGVERECTTDYVFFSDEVRSLDAGKTISIKYNDNFAVVVDFIKTFQEASDIIKQSGKEFLDNDRALGTTVQPKVNKFLRIAKIAIIALIIIFIALLITSIVTKITILFYIGFRLLVAGFISFGVIFTILYFGNNK